MVREKFHVGIAGGMGSQVKTLIRIGHLGNINAPMILGCLAGIEAAMLTNGIRFGRDGVQKSIDCLVAGQ